MSLVLIADDLAVIRELLTATLRNAGYQTVCAANGAEALAAVKLQVPDVILLDVSMPQMSGLEVLEALRSSPATTNVPVIMLTASGEKQNVVQASKWGVQDYVLKSHFALKELLARVRKYAPGTCSGSAVASALSPSPATFPDAIAQPSAARTSNDAEVNVKQAAPDRAAALPTSAGQSLTRQQTLEQLEHHTESKTLAGVVAEIIALTNSPRTGLAELVELLKRDALMCARVIQVANTAAFTTNKPRVSTIEDAVRNVGLSNVRQIATSVGFFDAFPPDAADGFNLIRCWQHSFAVAAIMDRLLAGSQAIQPGLAHLVGLCHDLGEIVLRQCFGETYVAAVEASVQSATSLNQQITIQFGLRHDELSERVLSRLGLPPAITTPIREYVDGSRASGTAGLLAQALKLADSYAHGLMLASSPHAAVAPVTVADFRSVSPAPITIDGDTLRSEVLSNTSLLARLSREDESRLARPYFQRRNLRVYYARHPGLSDFDPLGAALSSVANVDVREQAPQSPADVEGYDGVVVTVSRPGINPFPLDALAAVTQRLGRAIPVFCLCGKMDSQLPALPPHVHVLPYPIGLSQLDHVISELKPRERRAA